MVLIEKLGAVLAFAEEDFAAPRVHLGVVCDVVHFAIVDRPAVLVCLMRLDVLKAVIDFVWVLN